MDRPLSAGCDVLPQVASLNTWGVLFSNVGRMKHEIDRRISAVAAVLWTLHRSIGVKRKLRDKAKLSVYHSVPTLAYGDERKFPPQGSWTPL